MPGASGRYTGGPDTCRDVVKALAWIAPAGAGRYTGGAAAGGFGFETALPCAVGAAGGRRADGGEGIAAGLLRIMDGVYVCRCDSRKLRTWRTASGIFSGVSFQGYMLS